MSADPARIVDNPGTIQVQADATVPAYAVQQMPDGSAGVLNSAVGASSGDFNNWTTWGQVRFLKDTTAAILKGGRVYWDRSAGQATYRKVNDRDFYLGRAVADEAQANPTVTVLLNANPAHDIDLVRDSFVTAIVGTQALGGLALNRRGGALDAVISSTNEAQKLDALSIDGFAAGGANAIVEFAFCVPSNGAASAVDASVGIASGTHATDADSIAQHLLMHLDSNATAIKFQSKDGTTTVAATDSTKTFTAGQSNADGVRKEVWFDLRDPTSVKVYVDGVQVLTSTTFNVSAAGSTWRLLAHVEKTAAADTYEFQLDWLRARFAEV